MKNSILNGQDLDSIYLANNYLNNSERYIYNTLTRIGGRLNANFSFPAFGQIQAGIKFGISYANRLKMKDNSYSYITGKDRFSSNISLNLYF